MSFLASFVQYSFFLFLWIFVLFGIFGLLHLLIRVKFPDHNELQFFIPLLVDLCIIFKLVGQIASQNNLRYFEKENGQPYICWFYRVYQFEACRKFHTSNILFDLTPLVIIHQIFHDLLVSSAHTAGFTAGTLFNSLFSSLSWWLYFPCIGIVVTTAGFALVCTFGYQIRFACQLFGIQLGPSVNQVKSQVHHQKESSNRDVCVNPLEVGNISLIREAYQRSSIPRLLN